MACGVETTIAGGAIVRCDNVGTSAHTGRHSGITNKFWFNSGFKVRVYWEPGVKSPVRQKPIIRGDFFAPLAEDDLPPAGGTGVTYPLTFPDAALSSTHWTQHSGPALEVVNGVVQPSTLARNTAATQFAATCVSPPNLGRTATGDQTVTIQTAPTARSAAADMPLIVILRTGDNWNIGTRAELWLYPATAPVLYSVSGGAVTQRMVGTANSTPAGSKIEVTCAGARYSVYVNDGPTPVLEWIDSGAIINPTANKRAGFALSANYPFLQRQWDSIGISSFTLADAA